MMMFKCGKHFCFFCGWKSVRPSDDVERHAVEEHGGCFCDPPDYRRFVLNSYVPDEELDEFYKRYPDIKQQKNENTRVLAVLNLLKKK